MARGSRPAHIIKFGPIRIERITESALQFTNRGCEILQHDTLPSRSRAPFGLSAAVAAYWSCERRAGFKAPVRLNFRRKFIKNWYESSDRRQSLPAVAIRLYEALRASEKARSATGWFARAATGIPPAGRSVTRATGFGLCPATGRKRKARSSTAKITAASMVAKLAPMQTLGPPPNGRKS